MGYWDTSALLKLYVQERDSPSFESLAAQGQERIMASAITNTEVLCALYRKECAGELGPGRAVVTFRKFVADIQAGSIATIPYGDEVAAEAETLVQRAFSQTPPVMIRSLDAIHIASALVAKATVLVATDARLRKAAALAGLKLLP